MENLWPKIRNFVIKYKEWLVIVVLLGLIVYFLMSYQNLNRGMIEQQVLAEAKTTAQQEEQQDYDRIINEIMVEPDKYVDLIKHNPFVPIEERIEIIQDIQDKFNEGRRRYQAGNFLEAKESFQQVLVEDPYEVKIDYRPNKPSAYVRLCEQEYQKQQIRADFDNANDKLRTARAMSEPGQGSPEELLNIFVEAQSLYESVIEDGRELLPGAVEEARKQLEYVNDQVDKYKLILINQTVNQLYTEAARFWDQRQESLTNLANAQDNLFQIQQEAQEYPQQLPDEAQQIVGQAEQLLEMVQEEVDRRYPVALQQAQQLEQTGQNNLDQMRQAYEIYTTLQRLRPEGDLEEKIEEMQAQIAVLEQEALVQVAQTRLQEARQAYNRATQAATNKEWEQLEQNKNAGLTAIQNIEEMPQVPELEEFKAQAATLRSQFGQLKVLPPVTGLTLLNVSGNTAVLRQEGSERRIFAQQGRTEPVTGIRVTRIGERNNLGQVQSVYVEKEGFRETEITK